MDRNAIVSYQSSQVTSSETSTRPATSWTVVAMAFLRRNLFVKRIFPFSWIYSILAEALALVITRPLCRFDVLAVVFRLVDALDATL